MTKETLYRYLGTNGVLETPIHLEDIYYVRLLKLTADAGHMMTNGEKTVRTVTIPEEELDNWTEIEVGQE
jgi:hypothetical protein